MGVSLHHELIYGVWLSETGIFSKVVGYRGCQTHGKQDSPYCPTCGYGTKHLVERTPSPLLEWLIHRAHLGSKFRIEPGELNREDPDFWNGSVHFVMRDAGYACYAFRLDKSVNTEYLVGVTGRKGDNGVLMMEPEGEGRFKEIPLWEGPKPGYYSIAYLD